MDYPLFKKTLMNKNKAIVGHKSILFLYRSRVKDIKGIDTV